MKKELIEILESELGDSRVRVDVLRFSEHLIDFYEINRQRSRDRFKQTLDKYNFETIPTFSEYPEYPHVTLFHGSGGLEFWPLIDYEGGVADPDRSIGTIIMEPPYDEPKYWLNDSNYEKEVKDEIIQWNWKLRKRIVFVWLSTIWQEIKGYDYGIVVKTLENNSVREFIFNDLAWDNNSEFSFYKDKSTRLERYFERDLTIEELDQRVKKTR